MKRLRTKKTGAQQLRDAAVDAAVSALRGDAEESSDKRALTGARAVATGAVLYTAVRAAFVGGRLLRGQRASKQVTRRVPDDHIARRHPDETRGEGASPKTTTPRPTRPRAQEGGPQPSLALPNRRWGTPSRRRAGPRAAQPTTRSP